LARQIAVLPAIAINPRRTPLHDLAETIARIAGPGVLVEPAPIQQQN
jgi:hypothetical protein